MQKERYMRCMDYKGAIIDASIHFRVNYYIEKQVERGMSLEDSVAVVEKGDYLSIVR